MQNQNLSTKHFSFNEKSLFRQNSLSSKNCLAELRRQSCCVFHHLRCSSSGKGICWDKGIILTCWYFTTKTCVKIFHQNCWGKRGFWLKRENHNFPLKKKNQMPQTENLFRTFLLQCFKRKIKLLLLFSWDPALPWWPSTPVDLPTS